MKWYKDGLKFKCTGCGQCCTGAPGYVWLTPEEIDTMAAHLSISREQFIQTYTRQVFGRYSLREDRTTYDCVFLKDKRCQVYTARPLQCRTFPWWEENLSSKESWEEAGQKCEGINHKDAPVIPIETIELESTR